MALEADNKTFIIYVAIQKLEKIALNLIKKVQIESQV